MNDVRLRPVTPLGILVEKLEAIADLARGVSGVDPALMRAIEDARRLASGIDPYIEACTSAESAALAALVAATQRENWDARFAGGDTSLALESEMLSGHLEGRFLNVLVHAMKATRILEIGLFTGYSALAMAEALPEHGTLLACELDPYAAAIARRAFDASPHGNKIRIEIGDAEASLKALVAANDTFDLVFIDADKAKYPVYFDLVLGGALLAPGGLICVDNTLMQGQPYLPGEPTANGRAIAAFNRIVCDDPRVEQVMLPVRDGITLIRRS